MNQSNIIFPQSNLRIQDWRLGEKSRLSSSNKGSPFNRSPNHGIIKNGKLVNGQFDLSIIKLLNRRSLKNDVSEQVHQATVARRVNEMLDETNISDQ